MGDYHDRPMPRSAVEGAAWMQETLGEAGVGGRVLERVRRLEREHKVMKTMLEGIRDLAPGGSETLSDSHIRNRLLATVAMAKHALGRLQGEDAI